MALINGCAFSDFFVIGAQKAGTTAICSLLDTHPGLTLSRPKEPMFFSRGDAGSHLHYFFQDYPGWLGFDWRRNGDRLLSAYADCFSHAAPGDLLGEGSTSYLHSRTAADRIAKLSPNARIVVSLRNPVDRAWSAYWHHLRSGHAAADFEDHLEFEGEDTLSIGEYERHLRRWFDVFPQEQIHVLLFERFKSDPILVMGELARFLEIQPEFEPAQQQQNPAAVPRYVSLQVVLNRRARKRNAFTAAVGSPMSGDKSTGDRLIRLFERTLSSLNMADRAPPPMRRETAVRLEAYYRRANAELSSLIDVDTESVWYGAEPTATANT